MGCGGSTPVSTIADKEESAIAVVHSGNTPPPIEEEPEAQAIDQQDEEGEEDGGEERPEKEGDGPDGGTNANDEEQPEGEKTEPAVDGAVEEKEEPTAGDGDEEQPEGAAGEDAASRGSKRTPSAGGGSGSKGGDGNDDEEEDEDDEEEDDDEEGEESEEETEENTATGIDGNATGGGGSGSAAGGTGGGRSGGASIKDEETVGEGDVALEEAEEDEHTFNSLAVSGATSPRGQFLTEGGSSQGPTALGHTITGSGAATGDPDDGTDYMDGDADSVASSESQFSDAPQASPGEVVTACFDEGLLFRIVKDNAWAFYNSTKTHEMHITFTFGKESELEALGRTEIVRNEDGKWVATTVCFPRETVPFIRGFTRGYQSSLRACPLSKAYYEQVAATNAVHIEEERHSMPTSHDPHNEAEVLSRCVEVGAMFVDPVFPPYQSSIERGSSRRMHIVPWARPSSYIPDPSMCTLFSGPVRSRDVSAGELGDSWVAGAIAALAENPVSVHRLFVHPYHEALTMPEAEVGAYRVTINKDGWWRCVIVDTFLPVRVQTPMYIHNPNAPEELWAALLQKAYAKVHGSYGRIIAGDPMLALQDMTGYPVARYDASLTFQPTNLAATNKEGKTPDMAFLDRLERYFRHGYQIIMNTPRKRRSAKEEEVTLRENGLAPGQCYTVKKIHRFPNGRSEIVMFEMSNPWGDLSKWKGEWRQGSPNWHLYPHVAETIRDEELIAMEQEEFERSYNPDEESLRLQYIAGGMDPNLAATEAAMRSRGVGGAMPIHVNGGTYSEMGKFNSTSISHNAVSSAVSAIGAPGSLSSMWMTWAEVRRTFTGCGVLFRDPSSYDYRVRGEFHGRIPTVCLLLRVTKKVTVTLTMSMVDKRRYDRSEDVPHNQREPTSYVEDKRLDRYKNEPLYDPTADKYDPIMLSLSRSLDAQYEQLKVVWNSNLDPDLPTPYFSFMESRDVSMTVTLTPREGPYLLVPRTLSSEPFTSYVLGILTREPIGMGDFSVEFRSMPRESQLFDNFDQYTGRYMRPCVASYQVRTPASSMPAEFTNLLIAEQNIVSYINSNN